MVERLKILFIAANPADTVRLDQDEEERGIRQAINLAGLGERVQLTPVWAVRPDEIQTHLLDTIPHVVHITGHGTVGGGVALHGRVGKTAPENAAAWVGLFESLDPQRDGIRLVVLGWCKSIGLAHQLSSTVDFVVGFPGEPRVSVAATFARALYRTLGFGRTVAQAFKFGLNALAWELEGVSAEEYPELITRQETTPDMCLLGPPHVPPPGRDQDVNDLLAKLAPDLVLLVARLIKGNDQFSQGQVKAGTPKIEVGTAKDFLHQWTEQQTDRAAWLRAELGYQYQRFLHPTRKIAPSRILRHAAPKLFGREVELDALDATWDAGDGVNVYTLVAWGGVGKTSLVANWVANRMSAKGWRGVEWYFDWSFYSQGTGESRQTSSVLFIHEALKFFGDPDPIRGGLWERGERLAGLIRKHRTLLVLDGIEPLQYPINDPQAGRLRDQGLEALVQGLAQDNPGLCVITTREHLTNVESFDAAKEAKLDDLSQEAAVGLLRHLQLAGTDEEMAAAWDAAGGHALTLRLLGRLIARAYGKDVRKWREVRFEQADKLAQGRSAFRVMRKYEAWLLSAEVEQQLELAVLRLTGLFDQPMSPDCLKALCDKPAIRGLTEQLVAAAGFEREAALDTLVSNDLLSYGGIEPDAVMSRHADLPLDAHPLIREYFGKQLKDTQPDAFKAAHSRLFDHLCKSAPQRPDTLEGLQPLYQAIAHGCLAGRHTEAFDNVYIDRISRGTDGGANYSAKTFGAIGADLAALAAFFDEPWSRVSPNLDEGSQALRLAQVGQILHALGRLTEALQPTLTALEMKIRQQDWQATGSIAVDLSELKVTMGRLADAKEHAKMSDAYANQIKETYWQMVTRSTLANILFLSGQEVPAGYLFAESEQFQKEWTQKRWPGKDWLPKYELLGLRWGFYNCDWRLASVERAAWLAVLRGLDGTPEAWDKSAAICNEVERRAEVTLSRVAPTNWLLDIALDHLTLARIGLFRAILANPLPQPALSLPRVAEAVNGLRAAQQVYELPKGLLTAALYNFVRGEPNAARANLDAAQQIAERGPMPLYLADIHLHRARLFHDRAELAKAAKLIRDLGYGRRYNELAATDSAAANWPTPR